MNSRYPLLLIPLVLFIATTIIVAFGIIEGWFGPDNDGIMAFCEHERDGYIKQPANSFSNLAFSIIGIYIAWFSYKNQFSGTNRISSTRYYPLLFSCSLIILGAGSFAMHATDTALGEFLDLFGMYLFSSFVAAYAITRWFKLPDLGFFILFLINVSVSSYIHLYSGEGTYLGLSASSFCFAIQLLVGVTFELFLRYIRKININAALGWTSISLLVIAFIIWNLSRNQDSILCDPHLWLQGHAIWHILDAVGTFFVFLYYASEVDQSIGLNQNSAE
ncbi:MAG: ceramidase domain-containing protein [Bacteroidota bacterium]